MLSRNFLYRDMKCGMIFLSHAAQHPVNAAQHFMNQATFHSTFPILVITKIFDWFEAKLQNGNLFLFKSVKRFLLQLEQLAFGRNPAPLCYLKEPQSKYNAFLRQQDTQSSVGIRFNTLLFQGVNSLFHKFLTAKLLNCLI